ncbi:MAG: hypothetical protein ACK52H_04275 [Burkholderiales bacterium]|jgi:hypothetical protein
MVFLHHFHCDFFVYYKAIWRFKTAASKMKDIALYDQLLGLQSAWSVKSFGLSLADQRIAIEVVFKSGKSYGQSLLTRPKERKPTAASTANGAAWTVSLLEVGLGDEQRKNHGDFNEVLKK